MLFERHPDRKEDDYCYATFHLSRASSCDDILARYSLTEEFQIFLNELEGIVNVDHDSQVSCLRSVLAAYKTYKDCLASVNSIGKSGAHSEVFVIRPKGPLAKKAKPSAIKITRLSPNYESPRKHNVTMKRLIGDHPHIVEFSNMHLWMYPIEDIVGCMESLRLHPKTIPRSLKSQLYGMYQPKFPLVLTFQPF